MKVIYLYGRSNIFLKSSEEELSENKLRPRFDLQLGRSTFVGDPTRKRKVFQGYIKHPTISHQHMVDQKKFYFKGTVNVIV